MARTVKQHDERLSEILNTAQNLFYRNGYEHTSITDIINAIGIAKGTFYHYFNTKADLLDQLIARLVDAIQTQLERVVENPALDAITKLNTFFIDAANYKVENREAVLLAVRAIYRDVNLQLRERLFREFLERTAPLMTRIVTQGIEEGVFQTEYGAHVGRMVLYLGLYLRDEFVKLAFREVVTPAAREEMFQKTMMYQQSIERIIGAPAGSLAILNRERIDVFFPSDASHAPREKEEV